MKKYLSLCSAFAFACILTSCSQPASTPKVEDTKKVAEEHNDAKFSAAKETNAQFLVDAAAMDLELVKLGELAQTNSKMPDVKKLGEMMKMNHTNSLKNLQTLASAKQVTLPTAITNGGQATYDKIMAKKGVDFDKNYCNMMVSMHKNAVEKFEKANVSVSDTDIKAWAETMLPALRTHLDAAITCEKKCEKM